MALPYVATLGHRRPWQDALEVGEDEHEEHAPDHLGFLPLVTAAAGALYSQYQKKRAKQKDARAAKPHGEGKKTKKKDGASSEAGLVPQFSVTTMLLGAAVIGGAFLFMRGRRR